MATTETQNANDSAPTTRTRAFKSKQLATAALVCGLLSSGTINATTQVRLQSSNASAAFSEGYALSVEEWSAHSQGARSSGFTARFADGFHHQSKNRPQVWLADIGTLLFDDYDGDGFHSGFSISMDVDSEFGDTEVYASIYIESSDRPIERLHTTSRFSIYGTGVGDEYRVDTELRANFDAAEYDITIDIHDAWSDELLDTASARGFRNLANLPLESSEFNNDEPDDFSDNDSAADVVVTEYAGAAHPGMIMLVGGLMLVRRLWSRRHSS